MDGGGLVTLASTWPATRATRLSVKDCRQEIGMARGRPTGAQADMYTGTSVAIGAGVGVAVGALIGGWAIAAGICVGAGVGVAIGAAIDARRG